MAKAVKSRPAEALPELLVPLYAPGMSTLLRAGAARRRTALAADLSAIGSFFIEDHWSLAGFALNLVFYAGALLLLREGWRAWKTRQAICMTRIIRF
mgnify:CR=1 FL=1